jgi:spectinomycin phosphotransferase
MPASELVITHGEPHPGNVIRARDGLALVDWDTVGLAPPERDRWMLAADAGSAEARVYERMTGRAVNPDGLALYRLRWALDDISAYLADLRAPHVRSADTEQAWRTLNEELTAAAG